LLAVGALAATVACGHGSDSSGLSVSGTDVSCGPTTYIANGQCVDLPPFSDASLPFDSGGASTDAGGDSDVAIADSPSDAGIDAPSGSLDLLAPCARASNVFFVETVPAINGPTADATYTNADTTFDPVVVPPLRITVQPTLHEATILSLALTGNDGALEVPTPGTYTTGVSAIDVTMNLDNVAAPFDVGTITIEDVQIDPGDGAPDRLHSLLLSYDLVNSAAQTARGCLRYLE
jgi:hypothetical protein